MKSIIICFFIFFITDLHAEIIHVQDLPSLQQANNIAQPGDIIVLKKGVWKDCDIILTCHGTAKSPITFKAEIDGEVIFSGKSSLQLGGEYIIVKGLFFTDGFSLDNDVWQFKTNDAIANNCRITNCKIDGFNNPKRLQDNNWIVFFGKYNRVDHSSFYNKTNLGVLLAVKMDDERSRNSFHSIDSNYFGRRLPLGSNGGEMIRVGLATHCSYNSSTIIKDNVFDNCDGETEVISIKSGNNKILRNVFKECQGSVVLRHGNNNTVEGNLFLGNLKDGTGGVRIINEGNWVVNNLFIQCRGEGFRSPLAIMNGVFNSPPTRYVPVRNTVITNNTFINCSAISFGEGADKEREISPVNVFCFNNLFSNTIDSSILFIHSKLDSFFLSNNITCNNTITPSINGFLNKIVTSKKWRSFIFPVCKEYQPINNFLPISFQQDEKSRLMNGFLHQSGCANTSYFEKILNSSDKKGIAKTWKENNTILLSKLTINKYCKNVQEIKAALQNSNNIKIYLTGTDYFFNEPIFINNKVVITSLNQKRVNIGSSEGLSTIFTVTKNSSLSLSNINFENSQLNSRYFISTDTINDCNHYEIAITKCSFSNFDHLTNSFFYAHKSSYADKISITNCDFISATCNLFSLVDEHDDKGYYNVEKISIENCNFRKCDSPIFSIYRGGMDESTMGPIVSFNNNRITNCHSSKEIISFYGAQQTFLFNNIFDNANYNSTIVKYEDKTRATHLQKKNTFIHSGTIQENKFVTNIK